MFEIRRITVTLLIAFLALGSASAKADESIDSLFERGLALYPQCVFNEARRIDDRREPAETVAVAALSSCREVRGQRVESIATMLVQKTPEMPRTDRFRRMALERAEAQTVQFDKLLKDRTILKVLENRKALR